MDIQSSPEKRFQPPTFDHSRVFFWERLDAGHDKMPVAGATGTWENRRWLVWLVVTICDPNHSPRFKRGILEIDMLIQQSNRGILSIRQWRISECGCLPPTLGSYIGRLDKSWGSLWLYRSPGSRELLGLRRFLLLRFLGVHNWCLGVVGALHIRTW